MTLAEKIRELIIFLHLVVVAGGLMRVVLCTIYIMTNSERTEEYKQRLKNTIIFVLISSVLLYLPTLFAGYF